MSDVLTPSELGNTFEDFITDSLGYSDKIYNERNIRNSYPDITTIDVLARLGDSWFLIQCKYKKNKVEANDVKAFVSDCIKLKNKLGVKYTYCPIYLTRIKNTKGGTDALLEIDGKNIYLYETETYINIYDIPSNADDFRKLLMQLHKYIVKKTGIYPSLKEWGSTDVLMAY